MINCLAQRTYFLIRNLYIDMKEQHFAIKRLTVTQTANLRSANKINIDTHFPPAWLFGFIQNSFRFWFYIAKLEIAKAAQKIECFVCTHQKSFKWIFATRANGKLFESFHWMFVFLHFVCQQLYDVVVGAGMWTYILSVYLNRLIEIGNKTKEKHKAQWLLHMIFYWIILSKPPKCNRKLYNYRSPIPKRYIFVVAASATARDDDNNDDDDDIFNACYCLLLSFIDIKIPFNSCIRTMRNN